MSGLDVVAVVLFVLPICDWVAAVILLAAAHRQGIGALNERALASVILAVAASIAAAFAAIRLAGGHVDPDIAVAGLVVIMLAVSIPALNWLRLFVRGGFRDGGA